MSALAAASRKPQRANILLISAAAAVLAEILIFIALGLGVLHLPGANTLAPQTNFIEADVVQLPEKAFLAEHKPETAKPAPVLKEAVISKVPNQGEKDKNHVLDQPTENITQKASALPANHGPVVIVSFSPTIPAYMRDKDLHTSVVIDFLVSTNGDPEPRLVGSSGDEELDAIALSAAKKWKFRPAETAGVAVAAKIRLTVQFDVH